MHRAVKMLLTVVVSLAVSAGAVPKGGSLYIAAKDVKLLTAPKANATALATLQPGDEVKWLGVSGQDKHFHEVEVRGQKGFVLQSNLTLSRPMPEVAAAEAAVGPRRPAYAEGNPRLREAEAELVLVEELNREKATPAAVEAKLKSLH